jgi:hypothetical protein
MPWNKIKFKAADFKESHPWIESLKVISAKQEHMKELATAFRDTGITVGIFNPKAPAAQSKLVAATAAGVDENKAAPSAAASADQAQNEQQIRQEAISQLAGYFNGGEAELKGRDTSELLLILLRQVVLSRATHLLPFLQKFVGTPTGRAAFKGLTRERIPGALVTTDTKSWRMNQLTPEDKIQGIIDNINALPEE